VNARRYIPAWVIAATVMVLHFGAIAYGIYLTSFVDERFRDLAFFVGFGLVVTVPLSIFGSVWSDGIPLPRRKPRGWRRLRREAEERAYVRDLEKELEL